MKNNSVDRNYAERFKKGFKFLTYDKNPYSVWDDLMYLFAVEISNTTTKNIDCLHNVWNDRESQYIKIAKKYDEKQRTRIIPQMFTLMVMEFEKNPNQDFFGRMFMELEIGNKHTGQFFTPYSVSEAMCKIAIDRENVKNTIKKDDYLSIYEPSCGAGGSLIASIQLFKEQFKKLNFQNHIFYVAQDLDIRCCLMCYIQLSLLGVAAIVKCGDTLSDPEIRITSETANKFWFTPMYFSSVWKYRRIFHGLDLTMQKVRGKNELQG